MLLSFCSSMNTMHVIPISGKDSLATAIIQTTNEPQNQYRYIFNDIGSELPETYQWLTEVEKKTGWHIERVGKDLEAIIEHYNVLPSRMMRFCTSNGKIKPFEKLLKQAQGIEQVLVYYGLRADEPSRQGYIPHNNIIPKYPLRDLGINLPMVLSICKSKGLKPPTFFWATLHDRVTKEMHRRCPLFDWRDCLSEIEFDFLFAGRSRSNCYFCFFQRQYEFIWLNETHPDLFDRAVELEVNHGKEGFFWLKECSLTQLIKRKDAIIQRRVNQVCKHIEARMNSQMFGGIEKDNELALTSCGLLCGK